MNTREALLRNIIDNPADDTARLVYADWAEEYDAANGGVELAAYIRAAVRGELGARDKLNAYAFGPTHHMILSVPRGWLVAHTEPASMGSASASRIAILRRGFVGHLHCTLDVFRATCAEMFDAHPIERVTVSGLTLYDVSYSVNPSHGWAMHQIGSKLIEVLRTDTRCTVHRGHALPPVYTGFASAADAVDALSDALVEEGRAAAREKRNRERLAALTRPTAAGSS
jgi:uncharacterized protein (TIGR02996 family)